jgi:hypothetical protein
VRRKLLLQRSQLALTTDEAGELHREIVGPGLQRVQVRELLPQVAMAQLEHLLGGREVLQLMRAKPAKVGPLGKVLPHQLGHHRRQQHLATMVGNRPRHLPIVGGQGRTHRLAMGFPETGRALDVGEHKGERHQRERTATKSTEASDGVRPSDRGLTIRCPACWCGPLGSMAWTRTVRLQ